MTKFVSSKLYRGGAPQNALVDQIRKLIVPFAYSLPSDISRYAAKIYCIKYASLSRMNNPVSFTSCIRVTLLLSYSLDRVHESSICYDRPLQPIPPIASTPPNRHNYFVPNAGDENSVPRTHQTIRPSQQKSSELILPERTVI